MSKTLQIYGGVLYVLVMVVNSHDFYHLTRFIVANILTQWININQNSLKSQYICSYSKHNKRIIKKIISSNNNKIKNCKERKDKHLKNLPKHISVDGGFQFAPYDVPKKYYHRSRHIKCAIRSEFFSNTNSFVVLFDSCIKNNSIYNPVKIIYIYFTY